MKTYKLICCVCSDKFVSSRSHAKTCGSSCRVKRSNKNTEDKKIQAKAKKEFQKAIEIMKGEGFRKENPDMDIENVVEKLTKVLMGMGLNISKRKLIVKT